MLDEHGRQVGSCLLHLGTLNLLTGDGFCSLAGGSELPCGMGEASKNMM